MWVMWLETGRGPADDFQDLNISLHAFHLLQGIWV